MDAGRCYGRQSGLGRRAGARHHDEESEDHDELGSDGADLEREEELEVGWDHRAAGARRSGRHGSGCGSIWCQGGRVHTGCTPGAETFGRQGIQEGHRTIHPVHFGPEVARLLDRKGRGSGRRGVHRCAPEPAAPAVPAVVRGGETQGWCGSRSSSRTSRVIQDPVVATPWGFKSPLSHFPRRNAASFHGSGTATPSDGSKSGVCDGSFCWLDTMRASSALPSRRVRLGMYRAYTLKSISGVVWPSIAATQDGGSPAARAFDAKEWRVWYIVRRRRPARARVRFQTCSRRRFGSTHRPLGIVKT